MPFMPDKSDKTVTPDDRVKLKPILGVRPGVYLACIYGFVLLIILFFIFLYPALSKPGSIIVVKSEPWGAAVLADGVYKAAAPCEVFVSPGKHKLELRLPGFVPAQIEIETGKRLFASLFFPLKTPIFQKLKSNDPAGAFISEAEDFAAWSFTGESGAAYQVPMSLSEGAYRLGPYAADPALRKSMEDTIASSSRFAVTRVGLRDLVRAKTLLDNQGLSPSPLSLLGSAEDILGFLNDNPQAALWLADLLTGEAKSTLTNSAWYKEASQKQENFSHSIIAPRLESVQIGGLTFRMVQGGLPLLGANFPPGTTVDTFYILQNPISPAAWRAFTEQEQKWKKENLDAIKKEGLVNESYLENISEAPDSGVSGISWHAVVAFCRWLNTSLPPQLVSASYEVHLPTEAEWEYAAASGAIEYGEFWEWCEEPYVPLSFLSVPQEAAQFSPERPVRGGSWRNPQGSVDSETRGSLPPSFCSPFVSARPVIVLKRNAP
jgi:formylglycine-generating enzyme required for sulfatase activity